MKSRPNDDSQKTALERFLESVGSYNPNLIHYPGDVTTIYHYTDLYGLQGIVDNHDLWLTHSRYCNDDEEMTHGFEVVQETIEEAAARPRSKKHKEYLEHVAQIFETPPTEGVYICCFCKEDNLLSQWRSYSANGLGVSIGFDPRQFSYITGSDSPPSGLVRLWKVIYERSKMKHIVRSAMEFAYRESRNRPLPEVARQAAEAIQFFIPTFKNVDFEEEKEIRLIFTPFPASSIKPRFRVSRSMLVPYFSLKEELDTNTYKRPLPITTVRVGPSTNKLLNLESTKLLLAKAGYTSVSVDSSDTPYRG